MKTRNRILAVILWLLAAALPWLLMGCAADGSFDSRAFDSALRSSLDTYERVERIRYPDRPVYPLGAPFGLYPPSHE